MATAISAQTTWTHSTPLGPMVSVWTESGLHSLTWISPADFDDGVLCPPVDRSAKQLDDLLQDFFETGNANFGDIVIDSEGWTAFMRDVYQECRQIEPGTTVTYKQLATRAGNSAASRAVGSAMARNRILLVIPCHRVVNSTGGLSGFSALGGLNTKQFLLDLES